VFGGGGEKGFVPSDHRRLNFVPEVLPSSLSWQKGDLDIRRPGNGGHLGTCSRDPDLLGEKYT
jgi:hypothetical protein